MNRMAYWPCGALSLALVLVALVAACNAEDGTDLERYFRRLDEAYSAFEPIQISKDNNQEYQSAGDFMLNDFIPAYEDYVTALSEIDPPSVAGAAHRELLDAHRGMLQLLRESADRFVGLQSQVELGQFFDEPDISEANERTSDACSALQQLGYANDVVTDVAC